MPRPIVLGVDDAADDGPALAWAESEAALRGSELRLLNACGDAAPDYARQLLDALADGLRKRNPELLAVNVEAAPGEAREVLTSASAAAGLLVVGARGSGGFPGLLVGSTSLHVAGTAGCPVVVVPDGLREGASATGAVVVGVDAKDPDEAVLDFAFEAAERRELALRAVHAWRYPLLTQGRAMPPVYEKGHVEAEQERLLAEVLSGWRPRFPGVEVRQDSVRSGAARELVTLSSDAALVVVGRHGTHAGPLARLGSVSLAVVQNALSPVAVVPMG
ncbi:universal stress protein [Streptacidiphilus pinicola]|uniref:Universal stress protein n=1 Tax=Streptacidiphilus pinicola TaxID=2219663 RepID=A0A2X0IT98_9ACTN|nr:universal stress protein [Streptacidiphilus pinicola]RAG86823.1 universal stress protein [Streptacidiphilus pinicola]